MEENKDPQLKPQGPKIKISVEDLEFKIGDFRTDIDLSLSGNKDSIKLEINGTF